jgi:methionyl-tRNA formyltransferase
VNDPSFVATVAEHEPKLLLSVYYSQIFRRSLLDAIDGPAVNIHPSLLPAHRGVAPLIWAIADGDERTGVTAHLIDEGIDTGDVLLQRVLPIHHDDTGYTLHLKAASLVAAVAADLLRGMRNGSGLPAPRPQVGRATYRGLRTPRINHLQWTDGAERVRNIVRALAPPLPGAYAYVGDTKVILAHVEHAEAPDRHWSPGTLSFRSGDGFPLVWAADGPVSIRSVDLGAGIQPGSVLRGLEGAYEGAVLR